MGYADFNSGHICGHAMCSECYQAGQSLDPPLGDFCCGCSAHPEEHRRSPINGAAAAASASAADGAAAAADPSKSPKEETKPEVPNTGSAVGNLEGVINVMAQTFSEISEHNRLQAEQAKVVIDKLSSSDSKPRSTIKYTTPVEFPKGFAGRWELKRRR